MFLIHFNCSKLFKINWEKYVWNYLSTISVSNFGNQFYVAGFCEQLQNISHIAQSFLSFSRTYIWSQMSERDFYYRADMGYMLYSWAPGKSGSVRMGSDFRRLQPNVNSNPMMGGGFAQKQISQVCDMCWFGRELLWKGIDDFILSIYIALKVH